MLVYVKVPVFKQKVKVFRYNEKEKLIRFITQLKQNNKEYKIIKRDRQDFTFDYAVHH